MRQLLILCSILNFITTQASWKISTVTKPVGMEIESAWCMKNGKFKQITGLTSKLIDQKKRNVIDVYHTIGDKLGECAYMILKSQMGKKYKIAFDSPSVYAVHSGRLKTKKEYRGGVGKQDVDIYTYDYIARVFLYEIDVLGIEHLLSHAVKGFVFDASFDIKITSEYDLLLL